MSQIDLQQHQQQYQNIFVDLPIILLKRIVDSIVSNLDKIVFTLVCKRCFENREKILLLDLQSISYRVVFDKKLDCFDTYKNKVLSVFGMKSYHDIFERSLERKNNIIFELYDFHFLIIKKKIDWKIPSNVKELYIKGYHYGSSHENSMTFNKFYEFIENHPNIDTIKFNKDYSTPIVERIPDQIKSIVKKGEDQPLILEQSVLENNNNSNSNGDSNNSLIPASIEHLSLCFTSPKPHFNISVFQHLHSLTYLKLTIVNIFQIAMNITNLPPNLEYLYIKVVYRYSFDNILEPAFDVPFNRRTFAPPFQLKSLHTLGIPSELLHYFTGRYVESDDDHSNTAIPNVRVLKLSKERRIYLKSAKEIPPSVTELDFAWNTFVLNPGIIPTSVKRLHLGMCQFVKKNGDDPPIYFLSEQHHFDYLDLGYYSHGKIGEFLKSSVKVLICRNFNVQRTLIPGELKEGIEELNLSFSSISNITRVDFIPKSVKHLIIQGSDTDYNLLSCIPETVDTLTLNQWPFLKELVLSPNIKTLYFSYESRDFADKMLSHFKIWFKQSFILPKYDHNNRNINNTLKSIYINDFYEIHRIVENQFIYLCREQFNFGFIFQ